MQEHGSIDVPGGLCKGLDAQRIDRHIYHRAIRQGRDVIDIGYPRLRQMQAREQALHEPARCGIRVAGEYADATRKLAWISAIHIPAVGNVQ